MAGTKLKAESSWLNENNGTDGVGFSALPNGLGSGNSFYNMGDRSFWWIAKESADIYAWGQNIYDDGNTPQHIFGKNGLLSVRCLKDASDLPLSVPNGTITNSYAIGNVSGTDSVGGIRGFGGMVENSYFTGKVTGNNAGGIIGAVAACTGADNANGKYCSKGVMKNYDTFTDERDGKVYKKVDIGSQTWMAENLNYDTTAGSVCYDSKPENCAKYGKLYNWETAKKACPLGWHLPSDAEWQRLVNFVGDSDAGTKLKAAAGWNDGGNGTDNFGFSALPGGYGNSDETFVVVGMDGNWWTDLENSTSNTQAWSRDMHHTSKGTNHNSATVNIHTHYKVDFQSVRCVNDTVPAPFGTLIDNRNGKNTKYLTVDIGTQRWMAENLNYDVPGNATDVCYDNLDSNCVKYGRLYNWATAMALSSSCNTSSCAVQPVHQGICPENWHVPSEVEWQTLIDSVGDPTKLKAASGWNYKNGNGTNEYGFSALPGGQRSTNSIFYDTIGYGYWWYSNEYAATSAFFYTITYNTGYGGPATKLYAFSLRCIHNTPVPQPSTGEGETGESTAAPAMASSIYNSDSVKTGNQIGTPKTTDEMKSIKTYAGWDFSETWAIFADSNSGYPIFREHVAKNIETATVGIATPNTYSNGDSIKPEVTVSHGGKVLAENTHYKISYSDNTNAGNAKIKISGTGGTVGYINSIDTSFTIYKAPGSGTVSIKGWTYKEFSENNNSPAKHSETNPGTVTYKYTGTSNDGESYNSIAPPINAGSYTLTAAFPESDNHNECEATAEFTIDKADGSCKVSIATYVKEKAKPAVLNSASETSEVKYLYTGTSILGEPYNAATRPHEAGEYVVEVTFDSTGNYIACTATGSFRILASDSLTPIPHAIIGLEYNGSQLTGIEADADYAGTRYSITGDTATNAGSYTAYATLEGDNMWEDETKDVLQITWVIEKAEGNFGNPGVCSVTYKENLALDSIALPPGYAWANPETQIGAGKHTPPAVYDYPGNNNYKLAPGNVTVYVDQADGVFPTASVAIEVPYEPGLTLDKIKSRLPAGYAWKNSGTELSAIDSLGLPHPAVYTDPSGNYTPDSGYVKVKVVKGEGLGWVIIADWTYGGPEKAPQKISHVYDTASAALLYTGKSNADSSYSGTEPPTEEGRYAITATFKENGFYRPYDATDSFTVERAQGTGTVAMAGWTFGQPPSSPIPFSETHSDTSKVEYRYIYLDENNSISATKPANVGAYIVEAAFPQTANHTGFTATDTFKINPITVAVTWSDTVFTYNGEPQGPKASADSSYKLAISGGTQTKVGTYTATATTQEPGVVLVPATKSYTIRQKELQVTWTEDSVFTYNKMDQSPRASLAESEPGVEFRYSNRKSSVGQYKDGDAVFVEIMNQEIAPNYLLKNDYKNYEIIKKDLKPYFEPVWSEFEYNENRDTIWATTGIFQDSAALQRILDSIVDYKGFAIDTTKAVHDSDNVSVLKGQPKIELKYDVDKTPRYALARRVETTQKATATIITDAISADNYVLDRRTITIMETESDAKTFCENAEGRCIAFSEEICLFLGGTVVSKCNETPIAHTPNPIPYTPAAPHYYSLKGTFLGTQKPTAPGIYIAKIGKQTLKIAVR